MRVYGHSAEGLIDLVGGDALVVEEGAAIDDVRAPELGVGEELDRVLVAVPQPLRLRRHLEGQSRLITDGVCCCSWCAGGWGSRPCLAQRASPRGGRRRGTAVRVLGVMLVGERRSAMGGAWPEGGAWRQVVRRLVEGGMSR